MGLEAQIVDLFKFARVQTKFAGVNDLLQRVSELTTAEGVVVWLPVLPQVEEKHWIFAAASYFRKLEGDAEDKNREIHLEYSKSSIPSECINTGEARWIDLGVEGRGIDLENREQEDCLVRHLDMRRALCVPLKRGSNERPYGAIIYYRCGRHSQFSEEQQLKCNLIAEAWPDLHHTMTEAIGYKLLQSLEAFLDNLREHSPRMAGEKQLQKQLDQLGEWSEKQISDAFNAREVALFFEDFGSFERIVRWRRSRWPWKQRKEPKQYRVGQGLTGACYQSGKIINISDVVRMLEEPYATYWENRYPGVRPDPPFSREIAEKEGLARDEAGKLAPVAVLVVPIRFGGKVLGVMRCSARECAPHLFGHHEEVYLTQVAARIAEFVGLRVEDVLRQRELGRTKAAVSAFEGLAKHVEQSASRSGIQLDVGIYEALVQYARQALTQTHCAQFLKVKKQAGNGGEDEIEVDRIVRVQESNGTRLPNRRSLGRLSAWRGYQETLEKMMKDVDSNLAALKPPIAITTGYHSMLALPVFRDNGQMSGVLELQSQYEGAYSTADINLCQLIWKMVELCRKLGERIWDANEAQKRERTVNKAYYSAMDDLAHQVRTPTYAVRRWATLLVDIASDKEVDLNEVRSIAEETEAMAGRSASVVKRMQIFVDLATDGVIHDVRLEEGDSAGLASKLKLVAKIVEREKGDAKRIRIHVDERSCGVVDGLSVQWDSELLDQSLEVLLENAVKYGTEGTIVRVRCGVDKLKRFYISVENRGVELLGENIKRLKERGARMDKAIIQGTQGTGLGLYLAASMMKAMKGEVDATATTNGVTEFRLRFAAGQLV